MIEQQQFESGASFNIFQANKKRARQIVSPSIITYLSNQLGELGITMWVNIKIVQGPTLMDALLDSNLTVAQLQRINSVRLNRQLLYWEPETNEYMWPQREVSRADEAFFDSVISVPVLVVANVHRALQ